MSLLQFWTVTAMLMSVTMPCSWSLYRRQLCDSFQRCTVPAENKALIYYWYWKCIYIICSSTTTLQPPQLSGRHPGQPRWAGTRGNIYPLTPIMVINHPLSASSIFYDPRHPCSIYMPDSLLPQSLSKFSLVYLLAWHTPLRTLHCCTISLSLSMIYPYW